MFHWDSQSTTLQVSDLVLLFGSLMSIHREVRNGKVTFIVIVQNRGIRHKKRFLETKFGSLEEAQEAANEWQRSAAGTAKVQNHLNIKVSARTLADLASWDDQAKELGVDLRTIIRAGFDAIRQSQTEEQIRNLQFSAAFKLYDSELVLANRSEDYVSQVRTRFNRFGADFGDRYLESISSSEIQNWLENRRYVPPGSKRSGRPLGTSSWNNWLRDLSVFFNWCISKKLLKQNPAKDVVKKARTRAELAELPSIWEPDHCQKVIDACRKALNFRTGTPAAARQDVAYIAIGLLCGLRPKELERLDWGRHIDFSRGTIWVSADIAKTRQNRFVPMPQNLIEILQPYRKESGPVSDTSRNVYQRLRKAGFSLPQDTLRHTFASWHVALYETPTKTAFLLGHGRDSEMLFSKYRALMKKDVAAKYLELK